MIGNLASVALIVLGPLVVRKGIEFFRSGLHTSIRGLRSIPSPLSGRAPPAELALLLISLGLVAYHIGALINIVFFPSTNRVTDLFLASDTPVNAATVLLRERVAKYAKGLYDRLTDTYVPAGAVVDELFRRMTSFEGRKIYLQVGEEPLLYCLFCAWPNDYKLYTLPSRLAAYGFHFVLFGILTIGDPTLSLINGALSRRTVLSATATDGTDQPQDRPYQPSRAAWRRMVLIILLNGLSGELFVLHSFSDVRAGLGRWNHWHVNILLARHALLLLTTIAVYLIPTAPERVFYQTSSGPAPSALQGALTALSKSTSTLQATLTHIQALSLSADVVTNDAGLRALREAKAVQDSLASGRASNGIADLALTNGAAPDNDAANGTGTTTNGSQAAASSAASTTTGTDPEQIRRREREAALVSAAKRAGIDVDAVRREAREVAQNVLKETEKRARAQYAPSSS